ncbi:hypothetical protein DFJ43DRAFT_1040749 [Lentinula guzmanii]|uniref:Uncharacterized protein n=1 Tax=Lentinula guzmanii TaxID=2804957 RepID=A0AA38J8X6_9AGAR|nr:hypothetical protein DFJ43DRAFT_1040749 [Lentinula guzmanii]
MVLNTSGNERQFSKVKIRKDCLRNWLQLMKLEHSIKVPRYGEVLQKNDENNTRSALIMNRRKWRAEMAQWKEEAQRHDEIFAVETQVLEGGQPQRVQRGAYSEEQLLMELLAQEKEDEMLDDGALEGAGDEYNGY